MAAILAIILFATLVAGELASRYSLGLLGKALGKPFTISYVCIFIFFPSLKRWVDDAVKQIQNRKEQLLPEAFTIREALISLHRGKTWMTQNIFPRPKTEEK